MPAALPACTVPLWSLPRQGASCTQSMGSVCSGRMHRFHGFMLPWPACSPVGNSMLTDLGVQGHVIRCRCAWLCREAHFGCGRVAALDAAALRSKGLVWPRGALAAQRHLMPSTAVGMNRFGKHASKEARPQEGRNNCVKIPHPAQAMRLGARASSNSQLVRDN